MQEPLWELRRPEDWSLTHVREAPWRSNGLLSPVENSECIVTKHTFSQESRECLLSRNFSSYFTTQ